jgi:type I restriction enzyme, S subunit
VKLPRVPIESLWVGLYDGPHATPKPSDDGPIFLGIGNLTEQGKLDLTDIRHIAEEDFGNWTRRVVPQAGDIVFTYEATLNRYAIIPEGFRGCLGRRLALIRPDSSKVNPRFLFFYFFGEDWRRTISKHILSGATVDRIPLTTFPTFEINLPSRPVQDQIAEILSAYDDLIENNARRAKILEEMAQMVYREWFVNFRFPGHETTKLVYLKGLVGPETWERASVGRVCMSVDDGDWIETKDQGGNSYRLLQISNIGLNGFIETNNYRFITEDTFQMLNCKEVVAGHILVARMPTPIGRAWLVTSKPWKMITAVDVAILAPDPSQATDVFLLHFLNSNETLASFASKQSGTTRARVTRSQIAATPLLVPPLELQLQFSKLAQPINQEIALLRNLNNTLQKTRDLLLPRLISGEVCAASQEMETAAQVS